MFSRNNIFLIIFLCIVIISISYYKTVTVSTENYTNLYYVDSPPKYKGCS